MKINGNFKIDQYKITGFANGIDDSNKIAMSLNGYLVCEFDKSKTYEFLQAMLGKKYMLQLGYDKERFCNEYEGSEVAVLRSTFEGEVAFVLKEHNGLENIVGITGVNALDELVAKDTDELFTEICGLYEQNEEVL